MQLKYFKLIKLHLFLKKELHLSEVEECKGFELIFRK